MASPRESIFCPNCGTRNGLGAERCVSCGTTMPLPTEDLRGATTERSAPRPPRRTAAYYTLFTGLRGQTPGKMAVGIKVIREDGSLPGVGYAALRETIGKLVSGLALLLGYLWVAFDTKKQGWHDKMAGTVVVVVSRRERRYRGPVA